MFNVFGIGHWIRLREAIGLVKKKKVKEFYVSFISDFSCVE
jgi:hypothetical protein